MNNFKIFLGIFATLAVSRFVPHPPNFTSLLAISFYIPAFFGIKFINEFNFSLFFFLGSWYFFSLLNAYLIQMYRVFNEDHIGTYLETLNLSIQNVHSVYLGANPNEVSFFKNIQIVDRSNLLEVIINLSDLIENNKISQTKYKNFLEEKFDPLYGKSPSTN